MARNWPGKTVPDTLSRIVLGCGAGTIALPHFFVLGMALMTMFSHDIFIFFLVDSLNNFFPPSMSAFSN